MKRLLQLLALAMAKRNVDAAVHQWHQARKLYGVTSRQALAARGRIAPAQAVYAARRQRLH